MTLETNGELREIVTDLRIAVGELKGVVGSAAARDTEDRNAAAKSVERLSALERWQSRIRGQIALLYFLVGGVASLVGGRALHLF
jgi:hypothetical protein